MPNCYILMTHYKYTFFMKFSFEAHSILTILSNTTLLKPLCHNTCENSFPSPVHLENFHSSFRIQLDTSLKLFLATNSVWWRLVALSSTAQETLTLTIATLYGNCLFAVEVRCSSPSHTRALSFFSNFPLPPATPQLMGNSLLIWWAQDID